MGAYLRRVPAVLRAVFGNRELRRVELAFAGFNAAEWAVWIAILVYAYERGGTTVVAVVALVQLVPAALFAPLGASLADRHRPGRVLLWGYVGQAAGLAATAVALFADAPAPLVYASAAVAGTLVTVTRPTMAALTPTLARTPDELTATNAVSSWVESASVLAAPALAAVLLGLSGPGTVVAVMAVVTAASALLVVPVPGPPPAGGRESGEPLLSGLVGAGRLLAAERSARALVVVLCADFVALGALDVLYPELAAGLLGLDVSWAGYLNAAFGAGATIAVAATAGLVGRPRLVPPMLAGLAVYVGAFLLLAALPTTGGALVLLALAGVGRVVLDVGARTLLQRVVPPATLARVFGLLEAVSMVGLAIGSLLVAGLVAIGGARGAIVGIGLLLPLAALLAGRALLDVDRHANVPVVEVGLLRGLPLFAPLAPATLESLARALEPLDAPAGAVVIREGETGDRFYVIADGEVDVSRSDGVTAVLRRGDCFGEIALLRDVRRTATCSARTDATLYALAKDDFLSAVTGHARAAEEAGRLADARLAPEPSPP